MHPSSLDPTYLKLVDSSLYQTYKKAFSDATGLSLMLRPADSYSRMAPQEDRFGNRFCEMLNRQEKGCAACEGAGECLFQASTGGAETITCFAGLRETAVPIHAAGQTVAFLTTGQILTQPVSPEGFDSIAEVLRSSGDLPDDFEELKAAWLASPSLTVEKYQGMITLLAAFGLQLSDLLNRIIVENECSEPEVVTRAKRYIMGNLGDKIVLENVAGHVGVSSYYFCKLFKQSTGMTLTEYVNRRRVEWAKRKLSNPRLRITEVAYDVGYQSLSQFNRSFAKYVGMSPSRFREEQSSDHLLERELVC